MIRNKLFFILLLSSIYSCKRNEKKYIEIKNGKTYRYEYYEKEGQLKSETPFVKDSVKDGIQKIYYLNGRQKSAITWIEGKRIGETIEYYDNGKIEKYLFLNLESSPIYVRTYDSLGKITIEKGEIFPLNITDITKFNSDNILNADIYVIRPPKTDIYLKFYLFNKTDTIEIPFKKGSNIIHLNEKIESVRPFNEFAIKQLIKDFDQNKQWEQTNILELSE